MPTNPRPSVEDRLTRLEAEVKRLGTALRAGSLSARGPEGASEPLKKSQKKADMGVLREEFRKKIDG